VPNHINITCERHNLFVTFMHSFGMWHSQLNFFGKLGKFFSVRPASNCLELVQVFFWQFGKVFQLD